MGQGMSRETCKKLIQRCGGMDFFPADPEVRTLLVDTLLRVGASEDHATRMMTKWLETEKRAPQVSDIVELSKIVPVALKAPAACGECRDGWRSYEYRDHDDIVVFGSKRCDCARGQHFAGLDKARLAEAKR